MQREIETDKINKPKKDKNNEKKREKTRPAWAGFKTAEEGRTKIM